MARRERNTRGCCGCLIAFVVLLAILVLYGVATNSSTVGHALRGTPVPTATATPDPTVDAYGWPVGAADRLFSPMHMPAGQARCVDAVIERAHPYAAIQAVLLTDAGRRDLSTEVQAVIAARCPA